MRERHEHIDHFAAGHLHKPKRVLDVVFSAFSPAFFQGVVRMFRRDGEMRNIVLSDAEAREQAIRHFFNRALRQVRDRESAQLCI